jgi:hypothetical protein
MHAHGENIALSESGARPLPYQKPLRTWASRGTGATCDLCNGRIHPPDIEYQVEFPADGETRAAHAFRMSPTLGCRRPTSQTVTPGEAMPAPIDAVTSTFWYRLRARRNGAGSSECNHKNQ